MVFDVWEAKQPDELLASLESVCEFGHAKTNQAFLRQVRDAIEHPGESGSKPWADLQALYRLLNNEHVDLAQARQIRRHLVLQRADKEAPLLLVHDPTLLDYSFHNSKKDRRKIGNHRGKGYEYFPVLAVDPKGDHVLGVVHDCVVNKDGPDDLAEMDYNYEPLFAKLAQEEPKRLRANHRHQSAVHIHGLAPYLEDYRQVIHAADCEFDDVFVMGAAMDQDHDFVIRTTAKRNVQVPEADWIPDSARTAKQTGHAAPEGWTCVNLQRLAQSVVLQPYKSLDLDSQGRRAGKYQKPHRTAQLWIGSCRVRLYRQAKRNKKYFKPPKARELNMVVVREVNVEPGKKPVCWILFTSLEVGSFEQLAWVAHLYELRWRIESYIRLLKSGWQVEQRRAENAEKIGRYLVIITIAAMALTHLRQVLELGDNATLDEQTYKRLKHAGKNLNDQSIELELRLLALIAELGGWIGRRRDPLGPKILMRGMLLLLRILNATHKYAGILQQALENPQALRAILCV